VRGKRKSYYLRPLGWGYYLLHSLIFVVVVPFVVFGMRGGIGPDVRPITLSNANAYVAHPVETALVLNTPFCIYRTLGKTAFKNPHYFAT
jgi:hypothetical protein